MELRPVSCHGLPGPDCQLSAKKRRCKSVPTYSAAVTLEYGVHIFVSQSGIRRMSLEARRELVEQIHTHFEIPRRIPNIPSKDMKNASRFSLKIDFLGDNLAVIEFLLPTNFLWPINFFFS